MRKINESNLVIGFATNQDLDRVDIFCSTIRKFYSCAECQVILAVNQPSVFQLCLDYDILPIVSASTYYNKISLYERLINKILIFYLNTSVFFVDSKSKFYNYRDITFEAILHPHLSRWFFYKRVLESIPSPKKILVTDVSDVFFQAPFFEEIAEDRLALFSESNPYGSSPWNDANYKSLYGDGEFQKIVGRPVACMGVFGGGSGPVRQFIDWMIASAYVRPSGGSDQVRGNRYAHCEGSFDNIRIFKNSSSTVVHLHDSNLVEGKHAIISIENNIIIDNINRQIIPIVHMYNRHPKVLATALKRLPSQVSSATEES